jgi:hypothetical protein
MKEVYYKGRAYPYKVVDSEGKRRYELIENGAVKHSVHESELDIKSVVSLILDSYYRNVKPAVKSTVLS